MMDSITLGHVHYFGPGLFSRCVWRGLVWQDWISFPFNGNLVCLHLFCCLIWLRTLAHHCTGQRDYIGILFEFFFGQQQQKQQWNHPQNKTHWTLAGPACMVTPLHDHCCTPPSDCVILGVFAQGTAVAVHWNQSFTGKWFWQSRTLSRSTDNCLATAIIDISPFKTI